MKIIEVTGDILKAPTKYWIVHCISRDCEMGAGLALQIRNKYPLLKPEIIQQSKQYTYRRVLSYYEKEVKIFNLVTKNRYYEKPTYDSIRLALIELSKICNSLNIKNLIMPRIGCGLDKKEWNKVKPIIEDAFKSTDIEIVIVNYKQ